MGSEYARSAGSARPSSRPTAADSGLSGGSSRGQPSELSGLAPGWAGLSATGVGGHAVALDSMDRCVSRRSSVVSTNSSFFERSFFSTPESRIADQGKKATLSYATLMLNLYNNISVDLKAAIDASRRVVVQTVASKSKVAQLGPDLSRVQADMDDAIEAVVTVSKTTEFCSIKELLCHSLQVYEEIRLAGGL
ncbi:hypothetical protein GGH91_004643 [Coemansia sp. RSA 2671]|uniref:Uncharacterized protein n=1 Tax=Coemansia linderi TaxID=2663919 RepID=A0ACC1JN61_9FUNG|nr:hypothetical protein LPJ60_003865 [Coemansia sp. RSA 2675]KAJ2025763.1 hypothetical protein IWW57_003270 [Coemansia sp. S610]KAJ2338983.1 hypothetical protein GGH91_004643 [Coemansia sp. RSA 2671]KAJ2763842.1 hypothetical protein GGI18_006579 [Coemansia linderi]